VYVQAEKKAGSGVHMLFMYAHEITCSLAFMVLSNNKKWNNKSSTFCSYFSIHSNVNFVDVLYITVHLGTMILTFSEKIRNQSEYFCFEEKREFFACHIEAKQQNSKAK
jgi:hypothetical protein